MTGDAHIVVDSSDGEVLSVLYDEVFFDDQDKAYLWVVKDNLIQRHYVDIGLQGDIYTHIVSEVTDTVVVGINADIEVKEGYRAKFVKK